MRKSLPIINVLIFLLHFTVTSSSVSYTHLDVYKRQVGTFKPITSPDGKSIAYMHAIYDDNFENILQTDIETININTKKVTKIAKNSYLILVGWIK